MNGQGALVSPNGMTRHSYSPILVLKEVFHSSPSLIDMNHEAPSVTRSGKAFSLKTMTNTMLITVRTAKEECDVGHCSVLEFGL